MSLCVVSEIIDKVPVSVPHDSIVFRPCASLHSSSRLPSSFSPSLPQTSRLTPRDKFDLDSLHLVAASHGQDHSPSRPILNHTPGSPLSDVFTLTPRCPQFSQTDVPTPLRTSLDLDTLGRSSITVTLEFPVQARLSSAPRLQAIS